MIELLSDLGGGKTTFVRGMVRGMASADAVASPTFTISRIYHAGKLEVHHFDFYRLSEPGLIAAELAEATSDPHIVTVIEWADIVQDVLPKERLRVTIRHTPAGTRQLIFHAPRPLHYLIEALQ